MENIPRGLGLFGTADDIAVQRGIAEFQAGRPVIIADADELIVALPVDGLTDRELEVFRLIGEGHSTRQISDELHLSVKTVETYQSHIKEKMGLKNARELVQYAIQWVMSEISTSEANH